MALAVKLLLIEEQKTLVFGFNSRPNKKNDDRRTNKINLKKAFMELIDL